MPTKATLKQINTSLHRRLTFVEQENLRIKDWLKLSVEVIENLNKVLKQGIEQLNVSFNKRNH